jgi:hypothetical protein
MHGRVACACVWCSGCSARRDHGRTGPLLQETSAAGSGANSCVMFWYTAPMKSPAPISPLLVAVLAAGCGGTVVQEPPGGAGGGASSASSAQSGGGASPTACGGRRGATCSGDQVCDWSDDSCGSADGEGTCAPRPEGCPEDCPGVCGCDGLFYCNTCGAHSAGVDVSALASCTPEGRYSALYLAGGLDHLILRKADVAADRCVLLFADAPMESAPGLEISLPSDWGVSRALITHRADDCAGELGAPQGEVVEVDGATGSILWEVEPGRVAPCQLDIDVVLRLTSPPAWASQEERFVAAGVRVEGGC